MNGPFNKPVIAQWIRLRLPSCGPRFKSQAQHLRFAIFNFNLGCNVERTKINNKNGDWPILNKTNPSNRTHIHVVFFSWSPWLCASCQLSWNKTFWIEIKNPYRQFSYTYLPRYLISLSIKCSFQCEQAKMRTKLLWRRRRQRISAFPLIYIFLN